MDRALFDTVLATPDGAASAWRLVEAERDAWTRERDAWARERDASREARVALADAWARERDAWARERDVSARESTLLADRAEAGAAALQYKLDVARGHTAVRTVLEQIGANFFPGKNTTDALRNVCDSAKFQGYLCAVSAKTHWTERDLTKCAKAAYGVLSGTVHSGSTMDPTATAIPATVLPDQLTLVAVAALFRFAGRDVRFYVDIPGSELELPSPARTPPRSGAASAEASPGKEASDGVASGTAPGAAADTGAVPVATAAEPAATAAPVAACAAPAAPAAALG